MEVPASISTADLTNMLNDAPSEKDIASCNCPHCGSDGTFDGLDREELEALVDATAQTVVEKCNDPMVHKLLVMKCLMRLGCLHTSMAEVANDNGQKDAAYAWVSDEGVLKAAYTLVKSVDLGPSDFTVD